MSQTIYAHNGTVYIIPQPAAAAASNLTGRLSTAGVAGFEYDPSPAEIVALEAGRPRKATRGISPEGDALLDILATHEAAVETYKAECHRRVQDKAEAEANRLTAVRGKAWRVLSGGHYCERTIIEAETCIRETIVLRTAECPPTPDLPAALRDTPPAAAVTPDQWAACGRIPGWQVLPA